MYYGILFFILPTVFVNTEYVDYKNHKVFKITPSSDRDVQILRDVEKDNQHHFWTEEDMQVGRDVKIQVAPEKQENFVKFFTDVNITATQVVDDVQRLIDEQRERPEVTNRNMQEYAWDHYQTLDDIYEWMEVTAAAYPDVATVITIGTTINERPIKGIVIDYKPYNTTFGVIEGGLRGREWISPATVTWVIKEFLTSSDPAVRAIAEDIVWYIFPVTNPDGYEYTFSHDRLWKKNRNEIDFITTCAQFNVSDEMRNGVDLNRNFGFLWSSVGSSSHPCDENFAGLRPFSEKETTALADHITSLQNSGEVLYYLSFQSFSQMILVPFSHLSGNSVLDMPNYANLFEIAIRANEKLKARHNTTYRVGPSASIFETISGTGFDWARGQAGIPISYQFRLRDQGDYGFLVPARDIVPTGEEIVDALAEMHKYAAILGYRSSAFIASSSLTSVVIFLFAMIALK